MNGSNKALAVFTGKSMEEILRVGGSESWVLAMRNAIHCEYLVCCRSGVDWADRSQPQGSAFLVGRITGIADSNETADRFLIKIGEFARVSIPHVWGGWRNPVKYTDLETLGIKLEDLVFEPLPVAPAPAPEASVPEVLAAQKAPSDESPRLSIAQAIAEAKRVLSRTCGVAEEAIEITIRW